MAAPATPGIARPRNETVSTTPPELVATCTSHDATVYAVIVTEAERIISVRAMVPDSDTPGRFVYQLVGPSGSANYQVRHRVTAPPVSGSWSISLFGVNTSWLPWNATEGEIRTAVEALPDLNPGDALVSGSLADTTDGVRVTIQNYRARVNYSKHAQLGFEDSGQNLRDAGGNLLPIETTTTTSAAGDIPIRAETVEGYGHYGWYAVAFRDGEFSGGTPWFRMADRSPTGWFWYSAPPTLTVTRPAESENFDGTAPLFRWQVDAIPPSVPLAYQEIYYLENINDDAVYAWATASVRPTDNAPHITLPRDTGGDVDAREFRLPHAILVNSPTASDRYRASFRVVNAAGQEAVVTRNFDIQFTPPQTVTGFTGQVHASRAYIDLSWNRTPDPQFSAYRVTIQPEDEPEETIFVTHDVDQLGYRSLEFPFNMDVTYRIYAEGITNGAEQVSEPAVWNTHVHFDGTVLSEVVFPRRVVVLRGRRDRRNNPVMDYQDDVPWNQRTPTRFTGTTSYDEFTVQHMLYGPGMMTAVEQRKEIGKIRAMVASGETLLYRDATGLVMPCHASPPRSTDPVSWNYQDITLVYTETSKPAVPS